MSATMAAARTSPILADNAPFIPVKPGNDDEQPRNRRREDDLLHGGRQRDIGMDAEDVRIRPEDRDDRFPQGVLE